MNRDKLKNVKARIMHRPAPLGGTIGLHLDAIDGNIRDVIDALLEDGESPPSAGILRIDLDEWSRIDEVLNYARFHDIAPTEALERLVNSGLSHENRGWTS